MISAFTPSSSAQARMSRESVHLQEPGGSAAPGARRSIDRQGIELDVLGRRTSSGGTSSRNGVLPIEPPPAYSVQPRVVAVQPEPPAAMVYRQPADEPGQHKLVRGLAVGGWVTTGVLAGVAAAAVHDPDSQCECVIESGLACFTGTAALLGGLFAGASEGASPVIATAILRTTPAAIASGLIGAAVRQVATDAAQHQPHGLRVLAPAATGVGMLAVNAAVEGVVAYRRKPSRNVDVNV